MSQVNNTVTAPALQVRDFPDWVSPIVVKELRQGLRSRMFSVCLIGLHVAMLLMFTLSVLSQHDSGRENTEAMDAFFWMIALVPILLLIPASGNGLIQGEVKSGTMELVKMTSLNWWNIVLGKWSAMVVQTLLLVVSTLPYVVFRYFLGGVDLLDETYLLYGATLLSLTFSALGLLSSTLSVVWRVLGLLMVAPSMLSIVGGLFVSRSMGGGGGLEISNPLAFYFGMTIVTAGFIYYFLLMTATFLTKCQETYSGRKRLLGAVAVLAVLCLQLLFDSFMNRHEWLRVIQVSLLPLIALISAEGMFHRLRAWPIDRWNYQRSSGWGKLKTVFSVSGWPAHLVYLVVLTFTVLLSLVIAQGGDWSSKELRNYLALALAMLAGLSTHVVYATITRWQGNLFPFAVVLNVVAFLLMLFAGVFSLLDSDSSPIFTFLGLIYPPLGIPAILEHNSFSVETFHMLHFFYLGWILVALVLGIGQLRKWLKWVRHRPSTPQ